MIEIDEKLNLFMELFSEEDKLAAAVIYEEKPQLQIKEVPESMNDFRTESLLDTEWMVVTKEFGDDFVLESGVSFFDAVDFCVYFGFEYVIH